MSSKSLSNTMSSDCLPSESLVSSNTVGFLSESSYDEDEESNENIICSWCQKMGPKMFPLRCTNGLKLFCSELCLTQCRRASLKKNKVCDWCKHVRHTVNYVDFQDGQQQLQFCSDKCLNQYKMNIFCRETQVHLNSSSTIYRSTSPSTSCPSHLHGLNRILDNSTTIKESEDRAANPQYRIQDLIIPKKLPFSTSLITSTTSSPSSDSISNAKYLNDSMANFRNSLIEKSIDNSTNKSITIEDNKDKVRKGEPCSEYKPPVPKKSLTKLKLRSRQTDQKNKCTAPVKVEEICESTKLRSCKNQRNTIGDENQNHEPFNIEIDKELQSKSPTSSKSPSNQTQEPIIDPSALLANSSMPLLSRLTPNLLQNHANGYRTVYNNDHHISSFPDYLNQRLANLPNRDGTLNAMDSLLNPLQMEILRHRTFNSPIRHSMFTLSSPAVANQPDSRQRPSIPSIYNQLPETHNFTSQSVPFNDQNNLTNGRFQYAIPHPFLFPLPLPIPLPIPIPIDLTSFNLKPAISTQDKEVQVNVYEKSSGFIPLDSKLTHDNDDQNAGFIKNKRFKSDTISI